MAVAILNGLWIWDEVTFNRYHTSYERIGQLAETGFRGGTPFLSTSMTYPLSIALMENYGDQFKRIARTSWAVGPIIAAGYVDEANAGDVYIRNGSRYSKGVRSDSDQRVATDIGGFYSPGFDRLCTFHPVWILRYDPMASEIHLRIELTVWTFAITCIVATAIALLTVSFQAIKAAVANPLKSLRTE
jgi:hypothetical protein